MPPRVTVLMPVFNQERFIDEAIRSVLEQDFADFELLIVDDASTDRTPHILRDWAACDERVVVVTAPENLGIPGALNLGLRHARAPYVARLDGDDRMMPRRLAAQVAILDAQPDVALVGCAYETIGERGQYLGTSPPSGTHEAVLYFLNFHSAAAAHPSVMFRRDDVLALGGYSMEFPSSEDYDLWTRLLRRGRVVSLPLIGFQQRRHGAQSAARYADFKRRNWHGIMGPMLRQQLGREITPAEIDALITVWQFDGRPSMSGVAERVMREAFARFCAEHADVALRREVRARTALQWMRGARDFARRRRFAEALRYALLSLRWSAMAVVRRALTSNRARRTPSGTSRASARGSAA